MNNQYFYTNFACIGNNILYRFVENGKRLTRRVPFKPSLFVQSKKQTKWKTLSGEYVDKIEFSDIADARDFVRKYENVSNFVFYGNTKYQYVFIADEFPEMIDYDISELLIANIDIEVASESGFAPTENPFEEITAITLESRGTYIVFGCGEFTHSRDDVKYIKCENEVELLKKFLEHWEHLSPDIITGWNVQFYDIPYLYNRIIRILGEKESKRLSPWKLTSERKAHYKGREQTAVEIIGVSVLDYMDLYTRFQPKQESNKLNYISYVELGEKKISYEEYGDLHTLYKKNFQKFIEYNIKDVELVKKLEEKLKLIEMVVALAYDAKVNYTDVFAQVRMWDTIIFNHLKKLNIVMPQVVQNDKKDEYAGAYVKDVIPGIYEWVVSFDLNSLYPMLISQFNISPECLLPDKFRAVTVKTILDKVVDTSDLQSNNMSLAINGHCFDNDKLGFLPDILMRMYEDRKMYKNKMLNAKKELERVKEELHRRGL